jgi:regulator of RNase E activity RraB
MTTVVSESWQTFMTEGPFGPLWVSFDTEAMEEEVRASRPKCLRVIMQVDEPDEDGLPGEDETDVLGALEDELVDRFTIAKAPVRLVGRLTHGGLRELVLQVGDVEAAKMVITGWSGAAELEVDLHEHEGWTFFDDMVWPSDADWEQIANRDLVEQLVEAGCDPTAPVAADFTFTGPHEALVALSATLRDSGFEVALDDGGEVLEATQEVGLEPISLTALTIELAVMAERHGAAFDGWGAAIPDGLGMDGEDADEAALANDDDADDAEA